MSVVDTKMNRIFGSAVLVFCWMPDVVLAQDLSPLNFLDQDKYEPTYPIVRCAALYTASLEWAGQAIEEETYDGFADAVQSLLVVAALIRGEETSENVEHVGEVVMQDARAISDLYLLNFRQSYAATGNAWSGNPVYESDLIFCEPIAIMASEALQQIGRQP